MFKDFLKIVLLIRDEGPVKKNFLEVKNRPKVEKNGPKYPIPAYERLIKYIKSLYSHHLKVFPKSLFRQIPKKPSFHR
jgi:hypothetical protein